MGALHPILFFAGVYVVVLLFSVFICSSIFYSCNARPRGLNEKVEKTEKPNENGNSKRIATLR